MASQNIREAFSDEKMQRDGEGPGTDEAGMVFLLDLDSSGMRCGQMANPSSGNPPGSADCSDDDDRDENMAFDMDDSDFHAPHPDADEEPVRVAPFAHTPPFYYLRNRTTNQSLSSVGMPPPPHQTHNRERSSFSTASATMRTHTSSVDSPQYPAKQQASQAFSLSASTHTLTARGPVVPFSPSRSVLYVTGGRDTFMGFQHDSHVFDTPAFATASARTHELQQAQYYATQRSFQTAQADPSASVTSTSLIRKEQEQEQIRQERLQQELIDADAGDANQGNPEPDPSASVRLYESFLALRAVLETEERRQAQVAQPAQPNVQPQTPQQTSPPSVSSSRGPSGGQATSLQVTLHAGIQKRTASHLVREKANANSGSSASASRPSGAAALLAAGPARSAPPSGSPFAPPPRPLPPLPPLSDSHPLPALPHNFPHPPRRAPLLAPPSTSSFTPSPLAAAFFPSTRDHPTTADGVRNGSGTAAQPTQPVIVYGSKPYRSCYAPIGDQSNLYYHHRHYTYQPVMQAPPPPPPQLQPPVQEQAAITTTGHGQDQRLAPTMPEVAVSPSQPFEKASSSGVSVPGASVSGATEAGALVDNTKPSPAHSDSQPPPPTTSPSRLPHSLSLLVVRRQLTSASSHRFAMYTQYSGAGRTLRGQASPGQGQCSRPIVLHPPGNSRALRAARAVWPPVANRGQPSPPPAGGASAAALDNPEEEEARPPLTTSGHHAKAASPPGTSASSMGSTPLTSAASSSGGTKQSSWSAASPADEGERSTSASPGQSSPGASSSAPGSSNHSLSSAPATALPLFPMPHQHQHIPDARSREGCRLANMASLAMTPIVLPPEQSLTQKRPLGEEEWPGHPANSTVGRESETGDVVAVVSRTGPFARHPDVVPGVDQDASPRVLPEADVMDGTPDTESRDTVPLEQHAEQTDMVPQSTHASDTVDVPRESILELPLTQAQDSLLRMPPTFWLSLFQLAAHEAYHHHCRLVACLSYVRRQTDKRRAPTGPPTGPPFPCPPPTGAWRWTWTCRCRRSHIVLLRFPGFAGPQWCDRCGDVEPVRPSGVRTPPSPPRPE